MLSRLNNIFNFVLNKFGFEFRRIQTTLGKDVLKDLTYLAQTKEKLIIFDIGANVGQSAKVISQLFPNSSIHCFEPSKDSFLELEKNMANRNVVLN